MGSVNIFAHVFLCTWLLFPENELLGVESLSWLPESQVANFIFKGGFCYMLSKCPPELFYQYALKPVLSESSMKCVLKTWTGV